MIARLWLIALSLILWEALVRVSGVSGLVMPPASRAVLTLIERPGLFVQPLGWTTLWALVGLLMGAALGVGIAALCWLSGVLRAVLTPMALILASVPVVAILPILTHLFGSGAGGIVAVVAVITFLPVLVQTSAGLADLPPGALGLFASLGARRGQVLWRLALPAARPAMAQGLALAAPMAIFAAITAEYLTAQTGLGALIRLSMASFDIEAIMGAALLSCALSLIFSAAAAWVQTRALTRLGHL